MAAEEGEIPGARETVDKMFAAARQAGVPFEGVVPQGQHPVEALIQAAIDREVDLVVVGSHGRTGLRRLLMGSVTERVIGQSPCPVLVVKGRAENRG